MSFSKSQGTPDVQNLFTSIHIYQSLTGSNHTVTQVTTKIKNFGITLIKVTKIALNPYSNITESKNIYRPLK